MNRRILAVAWMASLGLVLGFVQAHATMPQNPYMDPDAPCFRWPAVDMDGDGVYDRVDHCVTTPKGCRVDRFGCSLDADGDGVCDGLDECPDTPPRVDVNRRGCSAAQAITQGRGRSEPPPSKPPPPAAPPPPPSPPQSAMERELIEGGRIRLEKVYFETASAKLLPESKATLDEAGAVLSKFRDLRIEVGGYTDSRGTMSYNQKLSQSRAEAVRWYLLERFSLLKPENLTATGYGETRLLTQERNAEELLRNRRVELKVLNPEALPRDVKVEQE